MALPTVETFDVWQYFIDGTSERVRKGASAEEAVEAAKHYSDNVAARVLGITKAVRIIDSEDYVVFEWQHGKGVTFL
jgi:hypothetical protein